MGIKVNVYKNQMPGVYCETNGCTNPADYVIGVSEFGYGNINICNQHLTEIVHDALLQGFVPYPALEVNEDETAEDKTGEDKTEKNKTNEGETTEDGKAGEVKEKELVNCPVCGAGEFKGEAGLKVHKRFCKGAVTLE